MTVKIVILKSGEKLISDIKEGFDGNDNLITYILENPCFIKTGEQYSFTDSNGETKNHLSISLHPWPEFSGDNIVPIVTDFLVSVVEPNINLKKMYEEKFLDGNGESAVLNEQNDFDLED